MSLETDCSPGCASGPAYQPNGDAANAPYRKAGDLERSRFGPTPGTAELLSGQWALLTSRTARKPSPVHRYRNRMGNRRVELSLRTRNSDQNDSWRAGLAEYDALAAASPNPRHDGRVPARIDASDHDMYTSVFAKGRSIKTFYLAGAKSL